MKISVKCEYLDTVLLKEPIKRNYEGVSLNFFSLWEKYHQLYRNERDSGQYKKDFH